MESGQFSIRGEIFSLGNSMDNRQKGQCQYFVASRKESDLHHSVIPAKAGIQYFHTDMAQGSIIPFMRKPCTLTGFPPVRE
jgi:hypothetical protein